MVIHPSTVHAWHGLTAVVGQERAFNVMKRLTKKKKKKTSSFGSFGTYSEKETFFRWLIIRQFECSWSDSAHSPKPFSTPTAPCFTLASHANTNTLLSAATCARVRITRPLRASRRQGSLICRIYCWDDFMTCLEWVSILIYTLLSVATCARVNITRPLRTTRRRGSLNCRIYCWDDFMTCLKWVPTQLLSGIENLVFVFWNALLKDLFEICILIWDLYHIYYTWRYLYLER